MVALSTLDSQSSVAPPDPSSCCYPPIHILLSLSVLSPPLSPSPPLPPPPRIPSPSQLPLLPGVYVAALPRPVRQITINRLLASPANLAASGYCSPRTTMNERVANTMLARMVYECTVAANSLDAIRCLQTHPFDLVLMDVQVSGAMRCKCMGGAWTSVGVQVRGVN
ncbi:unnamed protein product [Closterium sp. Naga37s-1]|nr:unnamed protein product [Closterium sp. Naga37s-1]